MRKIKTTDIILAKKKYDTSVKTEVFKEKYL